MNTTLPDMLNYINTPANIDVTVLQSQQEPSFFIGNELIEYSLTTQLEDYSGIGDLMVKPDPGVNTGWADIGKFGGESQLGYGFNGYGYGYGYAGFEMGSTISRTTSCPVADDKLISGVGLKKRKADMNQNLEVTIEEDANDKTSKGSAKDGVSKIKDKSTSTKMPLATNTNSRETSTDTSKENSKVTQLQKTDYIHVRARRGQATDSHSLAERVRREKISERMKYLQDLVPGCNKITGKAGMLDEIINYVQSLQRQVEFLSMKLAVVKPRLDFNMDNCYTKENFPASTSNFPANTSAAVLIPETFFDSSSFNQIQPPPNWDVEFQNLFGAEFQHARSSFLSQPFTGPTEGDNLRMGM